MSKELEHYLGSAKVTGPPIVDLSLEIVLGQDIPFFTAFKVASF